MNNTNYEHPGDSEERKPFREMALPLDGPKRHPQVEITPILSAVAGLVLAQRPSQGGQIDPSDLDSSIPIEGTAFFYAYPEQGSDGTDPAQWGAWLVTAKHVIEGASHDPAKRIILRVNPEDGSPVKMLYPGFDIKWYQHETFDVAVTAIDINDLIRKGFSSRCLKASEWTFNRAGAQKFGLSESDPAFMIGFPCGWEEGLQDYPVVRQGIIAQMRGWLNGDHDTFLIDGSGFPGMSGGPVFSKAVEQEDGRFGGRFRLIGLVSQIALSNLEENFSEVPSATKESADLITVIPTDAIHETIEAAMEAESASSD